MVDPRAPVRAGPRPSPSAAASEGHHRPGGVGAGRRLRRDVDADGDALAAFVEDHDLALVQLHTAGCPKCRAMEPVLSNVACATTAAVELVDLGDGPGFVERFDVRSVPTLVCLTSDEAVATTADGFQGTEAVVTSLERNAPGRVETVVEQ